MSIITLTGPTCAGKSTVERELQRMGAGRAISHTTRLPREGEKDGVDYHYVSLDVFTAMERAGDFIEVVLLGTRRYAMSKGALHAASASFTNTAIVVDPHGAGQIRAYCEAQNLPVFSVWVDCGAKEQAARFLSRLDNELKGKTGNAYVDARHAAEERLQLMLAEETKWRTMADQNKIDRTWHYHKKIDSSSRYAPKELAGSILWNLPAPYTPAASIRR